jgi:SAM-dependent methyltransferase
MSRPGRAPQLDLSAPEIYEQRRLGAIAARWDERARSWDDQLADPSCHLNEDEAYGRFLDEVDSAIQERRDFCASQGVLDVGCGTGLVMEHVIAAFAWGIGIDISPRMIQVAAGKNIRRARFAVGDCFALPAICPAAGAVLSRGVLLSHYGRRNAGELLAAGYRALVPGGMLAFDFLNDAARGTTAHDPGNKTYFLPDHVRDLAVAAGFKSTRVLGNEDRRVLILLAIRD